MNFDLLWNEMVEAIVPIALSLVCGGVLGIERGRKKRPAGLRTYMLVCLGATLVMMTNAHIFAETGSGDMTRMGAQVVSGIGFLGAGTIITTGHNRVKGLTTAAGLWSTACIGLAIGSGYYAGAIVGTVMIFVVMVTLHSLDSWITGKEKTLILYIEYDDISAVHRVTDFVKAQKIMVSDIEMESQRSAVITMHLQTREVHTKLIDKIAALEGIIFAEEVQ
jgi:putative Mg2+ transporter-C (MgtC) family protein